MLNLIQSIKSTLNNLEKEVEVIAKYNLKNNDEEFSELRILRDSLLEKIRSINNIYTGNDNPKPILGSNLISKNVIDYCNKWEVNVNIIEADEFQIFKMERFFYINPNNNVTGIYSKNIYVSNSIRSRPTKNSIETIVLHELAHICMNVIPSVIDEGNSPFTPLWNRFLIKNNLNEVKNEFAKNMIKYIPNYIERFNSFDNKLVELGLFDEHGNETFDISNVKSEMSWLNIDL